MEFQQYPQGLFLFFPVFRKLGDNFLPVNRLDAIEKPGRRFCLISLQGSNHVDFTAFMGYSPKGSRSLGPGDRPGARRRAAYGGEKFFRRFLYPVFPKEPDAAVSGSFDCGGGLEFGNCHKPDFFPRSARSKAGFLYPFLNYFQSRRD
jgi:hypothetical protein